MHLLRVALRDRGYKKIKIITARLGKTTHYESLLRRNVCLCPAGSEILDTHPRRTADIALLCLQCVARVGGHWLKQALRNYLVFIVFVIRDPPLINPHSLEWGRSRGGDLVKYKLSNRSSFLN